MGSVVGGVGGVGGGGGGGGGCGEVGEQSRKRTEAVMFYACARLSVGSQ